MELESKAGNEYDFDSSDEEDIRNTVGNIPLHWYDNCPHVGYDTEGRPIMRPEGASTSAIDDFLASQDDPDYWRRIRDPLTGQIVRLSDTDIAMLKNIMLSRPVNAGKSIEEAYWGDAFTSDVMETPLTAHPPQKRSFVPSKLERIKVGRMVYAIKMGWKALPKKKAPGEEDAPDYMSDEEADAITHQVFSDVWGEEKDDMGKLRKFMRPPKEPLPGHEASYNPPEEYLLTPEEEKALKKAMYDPTLKTPSVIPHKYDCLRHVPFSVQHIKDRYNRVRDLFMAPRMIKNRVHTTPEDLLPKIPSLADLRPYPNRNGLIYKGHTSAVQSVAVSPCGLWVASSSLDGTVRIWESSTSYCFRCYKLGAASRRADRQTKLNTSADSQGEEEDEGLPIPHSLSWNPNPDIHLLAVTFGSNVYLINPGLTDSVKVSMTDQLISTWRTDANQQDPNADDVDMEASDEADDEEEPSAKKRKKKSGGNAMSSGGAEWKVRPAVDRTKVGPRQVELQRITIKLKQPVHQVQWHARGDYLISLSRTSSYQHIFLHRLSQMRSQLPFSTPETQSTDPVERAIFHPRLPWIFLASKRYIRVVDLVSQKLVKTLRSGCDHISSMQIHPSGDHLLLGSYESKFDWFDLDLGQAPFKKLKLGRGAVRQLDIHKSRPLVSAAMDDGALIVIHGKVPSDLMDKPIIVPVQIIRAHEKRKNMGALSCSFHPRQAYIYSGGADSLVKQFVHWN